MDEFVFQLVGLFDHPTYGPVYEVKELDEGREATITPLTFGRARLLIGYKDAGAYDDMW